MREKKVTLTLKKQHVLALMAALNEAPDDMREHNDSLDEMFVELNKALNKLNKVQSNFHMDM